MGMSKGFKHSPETIQKMKEIRREWWAARKKAEAYTEATNEEQTTLPEKKGFWARLFG